MMEDKLNYILLGDSVPLPETDVDESRIEVDPEFHTHISGIEAQEDALREYRFETILENVGKLEFKENYLEAITEIKTYTIREQILLCERIVDKVEEVYDFVFPERVKIYDLNDVNDIYGFIEFIEYDFEDFIADVWRFFDVDVRRVDIRNFCKRDSYKIVREIEEQIETHTLNRLVTLFLRTYNKDDLIEWFSSSTEQIRAFVTLKNFEK